MRVLIINTSERIGGAAIAAHRLMEALKNNGIKAKMLVRDKYGNSSGSASSSGKQTDLKNIIFLLSTLPTRVQTFPHSPSSIRQM